MKKTFFKAVSVLTILCLIFGTVSLAAPVTSGGDGTEYGYYWCQDFNGQDENVVRTANSAIVSYVEGSGGNGDYALQFKAGASNSYAIIDSNGTVEEPLPQFDFSKGPMVLSYDVKMNEINSTSGPVFYLMLRSSKNPDSDIVGITRIEKSGRIAGYNGTTQKPSTKMATAGTTYHFQTALIYDEARDELNVKYYLDGEPMMDFNNPTTQLESHVAGAKAKADGTMFLRFCLTAKNGSATLDNITLRSEGTMDMDSISYIPQGDAKASVTFSDTAVFDSENTPASYPKAAISIPASQTILSGDNDYYTLTKYNATDNPLLLKAGAPAESKMGYKDNNGMSISGLDIEGNDEFYILKLKSPSAITSFAGVEPENKYTCLRRAALGSETIAARETTILGENDAEITLDADGKLPANTKAIKFITAKNAELTADTVKMVGMDGKEFTGTEGEPNVWTINITEDLTEGTEYTITLGDFSQKVTTTGEAPLGEDAIPIVSGGLGTDYGYYWCQDFNGLPEDAGKIKAVRKSNASFSRHAVTEDCDYALDVTATGGSGYAIIDNNSAVKTTLPKFDFSKGPMILSFDVTMNNLNSTFYLMLRSSEDANTDMLGIFRIQNTGRICGYTKKADLDYATKAGDLNFTGSSKVAAAGTTYHVQTALVYDEASKVLTVKHYLNGEPMVLQNDANTQIEYQYQAADKETMDALLSGDMYMRFSVPTKDGSVRIDNITLRSEGTMNMDDISYIPSGDTKASVTFTDTAAFDSENAPASYPKAAISIPASQTVLSGDNDYYTLTKYNATDNPLLLKAGTPSESKMGYKDNNGMSISGLDIAGNDEFYILKLKSPSAITSFAGVEPENKYTCLRRAALGEGTIAARETTIFDENNEEITLDSRGKLPDNTKAIKFVVSPFAELAEDDVKMTGADGKEFTGVKSQTEPNVWTITIDELSELTEYTITLGDFSQKVTTTGYDPNAFYWYEGFNSYDGNTLPDGFSQPGKGITFEKVNLNGNAALKYTNEYIPETSGTSRFSINGANMLDFSKGALLLSYDITPQSSLTWLGDGAQSNILIPSLKIGNTTISQLSIIEHGGIKAAYKTASNSWARSAYIDGWPNNSLVADTTVKFQLLLEKDGDKIIATQYINGKPVYYTASDETKLASVTVEDIPNTDFESEWTLIMDGRRFPGGLVFDNFHITTVDGVKASDEITIANHAVTAQINLKNTLQFSEDAPSVVKEIKMDNTAVSSDFRIKKYNTETDPLLLNGETVSGFDLNNTGSALVFSRLPQRSNGEIFTIELSDSAKIQTLAGKKIDTTVFKAGANPSGLKKTRLVDNEGDEVRAENGIVPSALSQMELIFTKNTEFETLPTITNTENSYSLTAVLGEDGIYRFDFTKDGATLSPNASYTVTYGSTTAEFTTGGGTIQSSVPVIDSDGKASVTVTNTMNTSANVYIISAYFDSEDDQTGRVQYEKFVVPAGATQNLSMNEVHSAPAEWTEQKVFIWNGFDKMTPYCAYGSRRNQ